MVILVTSHQAPRLIIMSKSAGDIARNYIYRIQSYKLLIDLKGNIWFLSLRFNQVGY